MRVSADGGEPELVVPVQTDGIASSPQFLDKGRAVLFTYTPRSVAGRAATDQSQIIVQVLPKGDRKVILSGASDAHHLSSGHLVYTVGGNVLAVPFDPSRLELKRGSVPVIQGVERTALFTHSSVSARGTLLYIPGSAGTDPARTVLALADRNGNIEKLPLPAAAYEHPRFSPDGKTIAFSTTDRNDTVVSVYDLSGARSPRRLTFGGNNSLPVWSRDGQYIYFRSDRDRKIGLFRQLADGTGSAERLSEAEATDDRHFPLAVDPAGKALMVEIRVGPGNSDIWVVPLEGDRKPRPLLVERDFQSQTTFSPDGRWIAYMSNELSTYAPQIIVQPYPMMNGKYQISTGNAAAPLWSADGKQVFYFGSDGRIHAVDVQTEPAFSFGKAAALSTTGIVQQVGFPRNYDISPNGKRFIVVLNAERNQNRQSSTVEIKVALNWIEELKQKVPLR